MKHQSRVEDATKEMAGDRNFSNGGTVSENRNWSGLRASIRDKLVKNNSSSACSSRHFGSTIAASDSPPQFLVQTEDGREFDHAGKQIDPHMSSLGSHSEFSHEGRASEPSHDPYTERPRFVKKSEVSNFDDMQTHPVIKRAETPGSAFYPNRRFLQKQTSQRTNQLPKRSIRSSREMCQAAMADNHRVRRLNPEASRKYHRTSEYVSGLRSPISTRSKNDTNSMPSVDDEETETAMKAGKARPLRSQRIRTTQSKGLSRQPTLHHNPYTRGKKYEDDIESYEEESRDNSSSWTSSQTSSGSSDSGTYSSPSEKQASERRFDDSVDSEYDDDDDDATKSYSSRSDSSDLSFTRNDKPVHYKNKKKTTGRLKRLKNKLGLIFHHHHHHHHHQADHHPKAGRNTWKSLQNMFHHKRKRDAHESQAVDKQMKKELARLPRKHQGHFSALMKGFKRHLKHPKKSKVTRLGSNPYGRSSKARKKLRWFGMLRGQRGVKLPNKGRLKFRLGSKKP